MVCCRPALHDVGRENGKRKGETFMRERMKPFWKYAADAVEASEEERRARQKKADDAASAIDWETYVLPHHVPRKPGSGLPKYIDDDDLPTGNPTKD